MAPHATNGTNGTPEVDGVKSVAKMERGRVVVESPSVEYREDHIYSTYNYATTTVEKRGADLLVQPKNVEYQFRTKRTVPKTGLMLVGWGGNNGSTVTAGILANQSNLSWDTREGRQGANYMGSVVMGSTLKLGVDAATGQEVYIPFNHILPMVNPNDFVLGGWDINNMNLADAMDRAAVLEPQLKSQVSKQMKEMVPLPSIYYSDFIAANQEDRANNVLQGRKQNHLETIRKDIRDFKAANCLDKVIVLWTANTERYCDILEEVNGSAEALLKSIKHSQREVSPSTVFAVASILEGCPFVNGSPQNTIVPGVIELAEQHEVFVGGDDFKSGQTKMKSALVDFLVSAGIKPKAISSYNHLGNNDGRNLSEQKQFRSKEISKSSVVDDMVASNQVLYEKGEHPDHCIVIKYMPNVGDSKRALDEYYNEIFLGGKQTIAMHNTCEDSLLAAPLIIDLAIITELMTRISWRQSDSGPWKSFHPVLSILSYMLKAPCVPPGTPVINSLAKQRSCMTNIFRAVLGLAPESDMNLEYKLI